MHRMGNRSGGVMAVFAAFVVSTGACGHETFVRGRACAPGETRPCYSGPPETEGVGACVGGMERCLDDASAWGSCEEEVTPQLQSCGGQVDDDCDGTTYEEGDPCGCVPGTVEACYTGPEGTAGVGICAQGEHTCPPSGLWGECLEQVIPAVEECGNRLDEDCDGAVCAGPLWGALFGNPDAQEVAAIAADAQGNAIVVGTFTGAIDFGSGLLLSGGGLDAFVAKLDGKGKALWSLRIGGLGTEVATSVAVDEGGDVVVAGSFDSLTLDLPSNSIANGGGKDALIVKLDGATGEPLWAEGLGLGGNQEATSVAIDADGDILVGGFFNGQIACFGTPAVCVPSSGGTDGFLARFHSDGTLFGAVRFGGAANDRVNGIALDAGGNAFVVGEFAISGKWGNVTLSTTGGADEDMFIAKLDPDGATIWARDFGDMGAQEAGAVAVDAQGNAVVTGRTTGVVSFGGVAGDIGGDGERAFAVQLSAAGTPLWVRDLGGAAGSAVVRAVAVDGAGNVGLAGSFSGTVSLGADDVAAAGALDAYLLKLDSGGAPLWTKTFGQMGFFDAGQGVAFTPAGDVLFAATIEGSVDFGLGALTSAGSSDVGAAAFAP